MKRTNSIVALWLLGVMLGFIVAPRLVKSQSATVHGILVSWPTVASTSSYTVTGYAIFRATSASGPFTQIATVTGQAVSSYNDLASGLSTSTPYYYQVQTLGEDAGTTIADDSGASPTAAATTPATWPSTPPPPASCNATVQ